jgi:hypothetical protein
MCSPSTVANSNFTLYWHHKSCLEMRLLYKLCSHSDIILQIGQQEIKAKKKSVTFLTQQSFVGPMLARGGVNTACNKERE